MPATTIELPANGQSTRRPPSRGRVVATIALAAAGILLALVGAGAVGLQLIAGDEDGYLTESADLQTRTYALATDEIDLDPIGAIPRDLLGTVRIRVEPEGEDPLFVGIGRTEDVQRYLHGVRHAQVSDFDDDGSARYENVSGRTRPAAPAAQSFWRVESHGDGPQQIDWQPQEGEWQVVAMNADRGSEVAVHATAGAKLGWLIWTGIGLAAAGLALIALAIWLHRAKIG